jgi:hypothetical protein
MKPDAHCVVVTRAKCIFYTMKLFRKDLFRPVTACTSICDFVLSRVGKKGLFDFSLQWHFLVILSEITKPGRGDDDFHWYIHRK